MTVVIAQIRNDEIPILADTKGATRRNRAGHDARAAQDTQASRTTALGARNLRHAAHHQSHPLAIPKSFP